MAGLSVAVTRIDDGMVYTCGMLLTYKGSFVKMDQAKD